MAIILDGNIPTIDSGTFRAATSIGQKIDAGPTIIRTAKKAGSRTIAVTTFTVAGQQRGIVPATVNIVPPPAPLPTQFWSSTGV